MIRVALVEPEIPPNTGNVARLCAAATAQIYLTPQRSQVDDGNGYSPVRHMATALFPSSCKDKYMLMLTAYMDETGHSQDARSKFNGMAGLITKAENWLIFEREWDKILKYYKIPYIHMSQGMEMFDGWPEDKKRDLSRCIWEVIVGIEALPIGSIIPMADYRPLESEIKPYLPDPYYLAMHDCMKFATMFVMHRMEWQPISDARVAMVFSDQVEFRHEAQRMYDAAIKGWNHIDASRVDPPDFRDMRRLTPLQAADVIAYEVYKEYDRLYYKRGREPRYGYQQLEKIFQEFASPELGAVELVFRHSNYSLADMVETYKQQARTDVYWAKKRADKLKDSS